MRNKTHDTRQRPTKSKTKFRRKERSRKGRGRETSPPLSKGLPNPNTNTKLNANPSLNLNCLSETKQQPISLHAMYKTKLDSRLTLTLIPTVLLTLALTVDCLLEQTANDFGRRMRCKRRHDTQYEDKKRKGAFQRERREKWKMAIPLNDTCRA